MQLLSFVWDGSAVLADLGAVQVRWYSLLFALGIILSYIYLKKYILSEWKWEEKQFDSMAMYIVLGTIIGARVGHCVFYDWAYYSTKPWEIILPFQLSPFEFTGFRGLASHGAAIGIFAGLFLFVRKYKLNLIQVLDKVILAVPMAAACIRIGNFFNSEIIGKPTDAAYGVVFVKVDMIARHASQLYEALLYLIIFVFAHFNRKASWLQKTGSMSGLIIAWIFTWRFMLEFLKENQVAFEENMSLNMGQWLSIPLVGMALFMLFRKSNSTNTGE